MVPIIHLFLGTQGDSETDLSFRLYPALVALEFPILKQMFKSTEYTPTGASPVMFIW